MGGSEKSLVLCICSEYRVVSTLPNRQFSFALAFVDFGRNDITCESKISHFARMVVRDEDVAGRKVSVDNL